MTRFIRLLDVSPQSKSATLRSEVNLKSPRSFDVEADFLKIIPGSPFAYWASTELLREFVNHRPFQTPRRVAMVGASTKDDFRYLRLSHEVSRKAGSRIGTKSDAWVRFAKGGAFSQYYSDVYLVLNWANDGYELKASISEYRGMKGWGFQWSAALNGHDFYFRPGITWSRRTQKGLGIRVLPAGCLFADKGPAAFIEGDSNKELLSSLALVNSNCFRYLVDLQMAFGSFEVGVIQRTPLPALSGVPMDRLAECAERLWRLKRQLDSTNEVSHAFIGPDRRLQSQTAGNTALWDQIDELDAEIQRLAYEAYGLSEVASNEIRRWAKLSVNNIQEDNSEFLDDDATEPSSTGFDDNSIMSWSVGVAFARFDLRLVIGERAIPPEPDPFDPLPAKSPGMLPDGDAPFMPTSGIFVDDPGHADDLGARVIAVYERVGEASLEPGELRRTLAKDFFPAHIRMYSKSRRKAPIYWQLATPSASYSVWLYIHAFGKDTLFRVLNDYTAPKLAHERRELEALLAEAGPSPTTALSRAIEAQTTFVEELSALVDEVKRVAPLWDPDLDDGVILNFAPLWRLVPQNRAWQKELRAAWAALIAGDYDWAHLSMRLWPERVVAKCAKDRSLAIAHDLEDVFWFEDTAGKWQARPTPTRPIDDLIADRTSPAVKAALQSLLDAPAPAPVAASGRGRRTKS